MSIKLYLGDCLEMMKNFINSLTVLIPTKSAK